MIDYLIKSVLCLLLLWGFYKLALESLTAHRIKRFYLLGILLVSLSLPVLTITYQTEVELKPVIQTLTYEPVSTTSTSVLTEEKVNYLPYGLYTIYGLGVLFFGFRFVRNLYRIQDKVGYSEKRTSNNHTKILLEQKTVPHSFLRFIFLSKTDFENHTIAPEIIEHELAHVTQKHSWDILCIEFLQVLFWFNPLLVWLKRSIALNHEFLADQQALHQKTDLEHYTQLLLQYSGGTYHTALSSPINYSLTRPPYRRAKKRIVMLSKTFSAKKLVARLLFLLPVLVFCVYFFNQEIVAKPLVQDNLQKTTTQDPYVYNEEGDSPKMIKQKNFNRYVLNVKAETMEKRIPTSTQLQDWQNSDKYGVWVDGKRIDNSLLTKMDVSDFAHYSLSKLEKNARKLGGTSFQVNLMTTTYFEQHKIMEMPPTVEQIQEYRRLKIDIENQKVSVNGKVTSLTNFAKTIDEITKDWTKEDMMDYSIQLRSENGVDKFLGKLAKEFHKTKLYQVNPSREMIPPPPPPAPASSKVVNVPTPPSPVRNSDKIIIVTVKGDTISFSGVQTNLENFVKDLNRFTENWNEKQYKETEFGVILYASKNAGDDYDKLKQEFKKTDYYKKTGNLFPPPPPLPVAANPIIMLEQMAAIDADFYYNGDKITAKKAKKLFKTKENLNFMVDEAVNGGKPIVFITDN